MTLTVRRMPPAVGRRSLGRRLWAAPPRVHLVGLALVLLAMVPIVGTHASYSSDEGAAVIQGRSLAAGNGWIVPHPMPEVDPDGGMYPLINSERGARGFTPLAKHPAYALLVAGGYWLAGVAGMMLLSVAGTVAAAGLAAALANRLDPALSRWTIWVVGLASPLFFDGFLIMGHTLGAALAAAAALSAVRAIEDRSPGMALAVAPCVAGAVLLRTEAVLFGFSLAAVAVVIALQSRRLRFPALVIAAGAVTAAIVAPAVERAWLGRILGDLPSALRVPAPVGAEGFLHGRLEAFYITWLMPRYDASPLPIVLLLVMVAGVVIGASESRRSNSSPMGVLVPAGIAALAAAAALLIGPPEVVPGLLVAFPALTAGLVVLRRSLFRDVRVALLTATSALFALAVIATQYATGGTGEWGGRYFALAIPVIVPAVLLGLCRHGATLEPHVRRGALAALVACSVILTSTALLSMRSSHRYWADLVTTIDRAGQVAGPGRPTVTTWSAVPRYSWSIFDRSPWLLVKPGEIADLRASLAERGSERFVFVTINPEADLPRLEGLDVVWSAGDREGRVDVLVLERQR
jgi:hypothetical protein